MNQVESKVISARRRIMLARFGQALCITLFVALLVATIAIALPALRVMPVDFQTWVYSWLGGCALAALISAAVYAVVTAPSVESVATEVDKRFGLRERLSSSLTLAGDEKDSDFGMALMADAEKRAKQLDVAERFSLKPSRLGWLPIAIAPVLAIVLMLVEPISETRASSAGKTAN